MNRSSASFRRMAWLALAAVVLSVAMPTASRFMAAASTAAPLLMEMCTAAGRQVMDVSAFAPTEQPPPAMADMSACGYCVLATPLPLVLLLAGLLVLLRPQPPVVRRYLRRLRSPRNVRGLGAQAPPSMP